MCSHNGTYFSFKRLFRCYTAKPSWDCSLLASTHINDRSMQIVHLIYKQVLPLRLLAYFALCPNSDNNIAVSKELRQQQEREECTLIKDYGQITEMNLTIGGAFRLIPVTRECLILAIRRQQIGSQNRTHYLTRFLKFCQKFF